MRMVAHVTKNDYIFINNAHINNDNLESKTHSVIADPIVFRVTQLYQHDMDSNLV